MNVLGPGAKQQLCSSFLQSVGLQVLTGPLLPPHSVPAQAEPAEHSQQEQRNTTEISSVYTSAQVTDRLVERGMDRWMEVSFQ